jgi:hypothetical protein
LREEDDFLVHSIAKWHTQERTSADLWRRLSTTVVRPSLTVL